MVDSFAVTRHTFLRVFFGLWDLAYFGNGIREINVLLFGIFKILKFNMINKSKTLFNKF